MWVDKEQMVLDKVRSLILWKSYWPAIMKIAINNEKTLNFEDYYIDWNWIVILTVNWVKIFTKTVNAEIIEVELWN